MVNQTTGGGGGGTDIVMDADVADDVRNVFNDLSAEYRNTTAPMRSRHVDVLDGAGDLADELEHHATAFLISWNDVFRTCGGAAGLIAGNTNAMAIDLAAFDTDSRTSIVL